MASLAERVRDMHLLAVSLLVVNLSEKKPRAEREVKTKGRAAFLLGAFRYRNLRSNAGESCISNFPGEMQGGVKEKKGRIYEGGLPTLLLCG